MRGLQKIKEKKLLFQVMKKKDPEAFAVLYDNYVERIYRFVFFKLSNKEEAEDVTSEIFLKSWRYLIATENEKVNNFNAFIYRIARNSVIDVYRERSKKNECSIDMVLNFVGNEDETKKIERNYEVDQILQALKKLKQEYQEVILLKYIEELKTGEMAKILDKSQANVRVTLHRALKVLKKVLDTTRQLDN